MKKISSIKFISIIIVGIAISIYFIGSIKQKNDKAEAFENCKINAESMCLEYGIMDAITDITYSQEYDGYDVYLLTINGTFKEISMEDIYMLVKSVDSLYVEYDRTLLLKKVILNNSVYKLDTLNENGLCCDGKTVYTYVSKQEKEMRNYLKDKLPYEGLSEKYIGYTKLGTPEKEYCKDYLMLGYSHKYITYIWRDSNGNKIAEATVRYWDFATDKLVDGYISHIWIGSKYADK